MPTSPRYLSGQGRYPQTSAFTCGAATLLNIAFDLGVEIDLSVEAEYSIWRQSNSVWMGSGHPGVEPWALALAGIRMGLSARLWQRGMDTAFDNWNRHPEKREVAAIMRRADRIALTASGVEQKDTIPDDNALRSLVEGGARLAVLTGRTRSLHWIAALGGDESSVLVHDPYLNGSLADLSHTCRDQPVSWDALRNQMTLNSRGAGCIIEFRHPAPSSA